MFSCYIMIVELNLPEKVVSLASLMSLQTDIKLLLEDFTIYQGKAIFPLIVVSCSLQAEI